MAIDTRPLLLFHSPPTTTHFPSPYHTCVKWVQKYGIPFRCVDSMILPLQVIEECIGKRIRIIMTTNREFEGKLMGMDEYVNLILADVKEEEISAEGSKVTQREEIFLNGTHVCLMVPINE